MVPRPLPGPGWDHFVDYLLTTFSPLFGVIIWEGPKPPFDNFFTTWFCPCKNQFFTIFGDLVIVKNSLVSKTERGGNLPSGSGLATNHHGSARKLTEAHGSDVVLLCARKQNTEGPVWSIEGVRFGLFCVINQIEAIRANQGVETPAPRKRTEGRHGRVRFLPEMGSRGFLP